MRKRLFHRLEKSLTRLRINKRRKFIITALLLSLGLLTIEVGNLSWRYQAIGLLAFLSYLLSVWSLAEGLDGVEWLTVLILPTLFTTSVGLFYFLISASWLAKMPIVALYGVGIYVLLLTENIFSVAAVRTIQLLRSAHAVGLLLTTVTAFFLFDTILAFRLETWLNSLLVFVVSLPLLIQGLWCVNLEKRIDKKVWFLSLILSLALAELAVAFSFWPVTVAVGSLGLTTGLYLVLGLSQHELSGKLFRKTVNEYLGIGALVLMALVFTTRWGGG